MNTELETKVKNVIDQIRPYLKADGGDIAFDHLSDDNVVYVRLHGACHSCPMALQTLKNGVEATMQRVLPEIKSVEQV